MIGGAARMKPEAPEMKGDSTRRQAACIHQWFPLELLAEDVTPCHNVTVDPKARSPWRGAPGHVREAS
jgi:hypothetical protein